MDVRLTDQQLVVRRAVREFAETEIRPHVRERDEAQAFPRPLVAKTAALGLMGIQFPDEYGGAAMSAIEYCIWVEELARVEPAVALSMAAHDGLFASHIAMFGTDGQKARDLTPLAKGECVQIHGSYGFVKDSPAEKFFRDVKLTTIDEGTSEVQRLAIARQRLAGPAAVS